MIDSQPADTDGAQRARHRVVTLVDELGSVVRNRRIAIYFMAAGLILVPLVVPLNIREGPAVLDLVILVVFLGIPIGLIVLVAWWVSNRRRSRLEGELVRLVGEDRTGTLRPLVLDGLASVASLAPLRRTIEARPPVEPAEPEPAAGDAPACPVCGQSVHQPTSCPGCGCAHHPECWSFVGGCASVVCSPPRRLDADTVRALGLATNEWTAQALLEAQVIILGVAAGGPYLIARLPPLLLPPTIGPPESGFLFGPVLPVLLLAIGLARVFLARRRARSESRLSALLGRPLAYPGDPRPVVARFGMDPLTREINRGGQVLGGITRGLVRLLAVTLPLTLVLRVGTSPASQGLAVLAFIPVDLAIVLALVRAWAGGVHWLPLRVQVTRNRVATAIAGGGLGLS